MWLIGIIRALLDPVELELSGGEASDPGIISAVTNTVTARGAILARIRDRKRFA